MTNHRYSEAVIYILESLRKWRFCPESAESS